MIINPNMMKMMQSLMSNQNPQQAVMGMLESQSGGNPLLGNILQLAKNNNTQEIEKIARNMMSERGLDYDKEFNSFKKNLGFK